MRVARRWRTGEKESRKCPPTNPSIDTNRSRSGSTAQAPATVDPAILTQIIQALREAGLEAHYRIREEPSAQGPRVGPRPVQPERGRPSEAAM